MLCERKGGRGARGDLCVCGAALPPPPVCVTPVGVCVLFVLSTLLRGVLSATTSAATGCCCLDSRSEVGEGEAVACADNLPRA